MDSFLANLMPLGALVVAQVAGAAETNKLVVYGPMGIICLWLMYRDEKRSIENKATREEIGKVAHEMRGFNLNWLMHNATHSPSEGIRELAKKELERKQAATT